MQKLTLSLVLIMIMSSLTFGQIRTGYVDTEEILKQHPQLLQGAEARLSREVEQWAADRKPWEQYMEMLQADIIKREAELNKGKMLSEAKRLDMQRKLDSLQTDFQQRFQAQLATDQERLQQRRSELLNEVFNEVREIVKEIGESEGYDIIIDTSGAVVYVRDPEEVTDEVLRVLKNK